MADNTADSVINAITKFAWPIALITTLTTGAILFWPSGAALFRLTSLPKWILDYAGLAFLISAASLACLIMAGLFRVISMLLDRVSDKKDLVEKLRTLSWEEKSILREFFLTDSDVQNLPFQHPAVLSLRNKGILFLAAKSALVYGLEMEFPHQLPSGVKLMIEEAPEIINLSEAISLHNTNRQQFEQSRPQFRQPRSGYY
jgi:hypothetical protein